MECERCFWCWNESNDWNGHHVDSNGEEWEWAETLDLVAVPDGVRADFQFVGQRDDGYYDSCSSTLDFEPDNEAVVCSVTVHHMTAVHGDWVPVSRIDSAADNETVERDGYVGDNGNKRPMDRNYTNLLDLDAESDCNKSIVLGSGLVVVDYNVFGNIVRWMHFGDKKNSALHYGCYWMWYNVHRLQSFG